MALMCAFCYEPTELVRPCLTPQCQVCAVNRELYPDQAECLPECTFQHTSSDNKAIVLNTTETTPLSRQVQLLSLVSEMFLTKVTTLIEAATTDLVTISQNLQLADLYQLLGLTSLATVKAQQLLYDQVEFQRQRCHSLVQRMTIIQQLAPEQSLAQLFNYLDQVETFCQHYVRPVLTGLLLPGQEMPNQDNITLLSTFKGKGGYLYDHKINAGKAVLAPGQTDDIIMFVTQPKADDNHYALYYNLTRGQTFTVPNNSDSLPQWLPSYHSAFRAADYVSFSSTGVWLYKFDSGNLSYLDLVDCQPGARAVSSLPVDVHRPRCLVSQGHRMAMITGQELADSTLVSCTAWSYQDSNWTQLWSHGSDLDELAWLSLSLTEHHVILAKCDLDQELVTITILDWASGQLVKTVQLGDFIYDEVVYFQLVDYRLHVLNAAEDESITYSIYNLDGQLAYRQARFYKHRRGDYYLNHDIIVDSRGQLKFLVLRHN